MDDRFDFILASDNTISGNKKVKYVPNTYRAIGQDGQHFNRSIIASPNNNSVPNDVLYALFYNSDHLPVSVKLLVDKAMKISNYQHTVFRDVRMNNPAANELHLSIQSLENTGFDLQVTSLSGQVVLREQGMLTAGSNAFTIGLSGISPGMYLIRLIDQYGNSVVKKLVVN
jgi:hypothetical protein